MTTAEPKNLILTPISEIKKKSQEIKEGKIPDSYSFDVSTVILIKKGVVKVPNLKPLPQPEVKAGGPPTLIKRHD